MRRTRAVACALPLLLLASAAITLPRPAGAQASAPSAAAPAARLYAVEIKIGPKWVAAKAPPEQDFFREHSQNLARLREQGLLVLGARYGDKGLVVLQADSEAAARALVDQDPAMRHGTLVYEIAEFSVFYGGSVAPVRRAR
jgi:uncharacterized protein YciI